MPDSLTSILTPSVAFDGWAVALITLLLGALGIGTYRYLTRSKIRQRQQGGSASRQQQEIRRATTRDINDINQSQQAGDNADQTQIS